MNLKQVLQEVLEEEEGQGSEVIQDPQALEGSKVNYSTTLLLTTTSQISSMLLPCRYNQINNHTWR